MTSIQAKIMMKILQLRAFSWANGSIAEQRSRQEKTARFFKIQSDVIITDQNIDGIRAELIDRESTKKGIILYLHGGAYAVGSVNVHREFLARLGKACQIKVLAIDYRLAPENQFPAALEDSLAAYSWLISKGYDPSNIVIAGDSAGGGLAIATLISLRDRNKPLPACAVCISPWVNLSYTCKKSNNNNDPILNPEILSTYSSYYAGQSDSSNPLISPIFANLQGLPPMLIQVGTNEILLDQVQQFVEKARQAEIEILIDFWQGLFHVFQIIPIIPETKLSLEKIANFIASKIE
ncbi:MAG: alpha/beta hydrolase [Chloroflexi bacterium HGW-Chloroflexi-8]|jgi:acetyl esterase/lipase|nr:MAG: alpha/beta hydrolase [Chloroflexi bacterium HGW-Chloroflexi-8]